MISRFTLAEIMKFLIIVVIKKKLKIKINNIIIITLYDLSYKLLLYTFAKFYF